MLGLGNNVVLKPSINQISSISPSISLLTQSGELNSVNFCNETSIPIRCRAKGYCECVHRIKVALNEVIELVVVDEATAPGLVNHPFHLHGHQLFVTEIGQNVEDSPITVESTRQFRSSRPRPRIANRRFPIKDTISIPSKGYTVFRFKANNPGFWLGHCHYAWHLAGGMNFVLQVGEPHQMIPPPPNFPKCGNSDSNNLVLNLKPQWIPVTSSSQLPINCHVGGYDAPYVTYVGRRKFVNEIAIGKVVLNTKKVCGELNFSPVFFETLMIP